MIDYEPRMNWRDLLAGMLIYLGFLFFLVVLHLLAINNIGYTKEVLITLFQVSMYIYIGMVIFGFVGILIQLLRWLTWSVETATWQKKKIRGNK